MGTEHACVGVMHLMLHLHCCTAGESACACVPVPHHTCHCRHPVLLASAALWLCSACVGQARAAPLRTSQGQAWRSRCTTGPVRNMATVPPLPHAFVPLLGWHACGPAAVQGCGCGAQSRAQSGPPPACSASEPPPHPCAWIPACAAHSCCSSRSCCSCLSSGCAAACSACALIAAACACSCAAACARCCLSCGASRGWGYGCGCGPNVGSGYSCYCGGHHAPVLFDFGPGPRPALAWVLLAGHVGEVKRVV